MNKVNANVNLLKENVTRINVGKTINVNVSVKMSCMWKRLFGILLHVVVKMENV